MTDRIPFAADQFWIPLSDAGQTASFAPQALLITHAEGNPGHHETVMPLLVEMCPVYPVPNCFLLRLQSIAPTFTRTICLRIVALFYSQPSPSFNNGDGDELSNRRCG